MALTLAEKLAALRIKCGLDKAPEPTAPPKYDPEAYRPRPIWDVPTDHGIVTRHGTDYVDACEKCRLSGLTVV